MIAQHATFHRFTEARHPQAPLADMDTCPECFAAIGDCDCWDDPFSDPTGDVDLTEGEVF